MAEVFNFEVQAAPTGTASFSVITAQFGDGYSQAAADGINNKKQSWSVRIRGTDGASCVPTADMLAAEAFLDEHAGWKSFEWTTPRGYTGLFRCDNYGIQSEGGEVYTFNAQFYEVFA